MSPPPIVIIGAGISGIGAARDLTKEFIILEKERVIGGLSTQYPSGGYRFDYGGHYFHFKDKEQIKAYLQALHPLREYRRSSKVFVLDRFIPFPIQFHLSFLPARLRQTILDEILPPRAGKAENLYAYLERNFGPHLFRLFFEPFLHKYYSCDLRQMAAHMDKGSIPVPDKKTVLAGVGGKRFFEAGYNPVFYYPEGGLRKFFHAFARPVQPKISLSEEVVEIDLLKKTLRTSGRTIPYEYVINTMPLKSLLKVVTPADRLPAPRHLRHTSTLVCNVVLKRRRRRFHWLYLPEKRFPFYRVGFYPGQKVPVCYLERGLMGPHSISKDACRADIVFTLKALKLIETEEEIVYYDVRLIPISYVIFDHNWQKIVPPLLEQLRRYGIYSIGRYGAWNYTSMSDDIQSARRTAHHLNRLK